MKNNPYNDRRYARKFDHCWRRYNDCTYVLVEQLLALLARPPATALDIGCGTGNILHLLRQRYPHAVLKGIDPSDIMIAEAQKKLPELSLEKGTLETVDSMRRYDLIVSVSVLHYVNNPEVWMEKVKRLLTPAGHLLLVDWNGSAPLIKLRAKHLTALPHISHVYTEGDLQTLFQQWHSATLRKRHCFFGWWAVQGWLAQT